MAQRQEWESRSWCVRGAHLRRRQLNEQNVGGRSPEAGAGGILTAAESVQDPGAPSPRTPCTCTEIHKNKASTPVCVSFFLLLNGNVLELGLNYLHPQTEDSLQGSGRVSFRLSGRHRELGASVVCKDSAATKLTSRGQAAGGCEGQGEPTLRRPQAGPRGPRWELVLRNSAQGSRGPGYRLLCY